MWDLLSVLPLFFIMYAAGGDDNGWVWMYSFNHFVRFRLFSGYLKNLTDLFEFFFAFKSSTAVTRIGETFVLVITITHWMACIFFFIGRMFAEKDETSWLSLADLTNRTTHDLDEDDFRQKQYVTSVYWALYTISTTGYGNIR